MNLPRVPRLLNLLWLLALVPSRVVSAWALRNHY